MSSDHQPFKYMLSLIEKLKQVKDFRKDKGKRQPLWIVLLLILGTMLGYLGYRELGEFAKVISYHLSEASYQFTVYWTATPRLWQH